MSWPLFPDQDGVDLLCLDEVFEEAMDPNTGHVVTLMKVLANPFPKYTVPEGKRVPTCDLAVKEITVLTQDPQGKQTT